jgi:hypothetical protein
MRGGSHQTRCLRFVFRPSASAAAAAAAVAAAAAAAVDGGDDDKSVDARRSRGRGSRPIWLMACDDITMPQARVRDTGRGRSTATRLSVAHKLVLMT